MSLLDIIWYGSLVLSALSITLCLALWVRRLFIQRAEAKLAARREIITAALIAFIENPAAETALSARRGAVDQRLLLGVATRILQNVTGEVRERVIDLLNRVIVIDRMVKELKHGSPGNRAKIAARLFWSKNPAVHRALRAALTDPETDVVMAAANSLLLAGQPLDIAEVIGPLKERGMLHHRGLRDLIRGIAPSGWMSIIAALEGEDDEVALVVADAVGTDTHPDVLWALIGAATRHASKDVRAAAVRALGLGRNPEAVDAVLAALGDTAWEVQVQAAIAVGRMKLAQAIPALVELLGSESWWVQLRSAQSLVKLGPQGEQELRQLPFNSPVAALADIALAERHA
ncbi:MAG: HEAT repeat domain-containing protein [Rhodospirillaceae bacterium]|nr:HEAT repeat domain-containing protein [Rhodospirillaceae bacterium]